MRPPAPSSVVFCTPDTRRAVLYRRGMSGRRPSPDRPERQHGRWSGDLRPGHQSNRRRPLSAAPERALAGLLSRNPCHLLAGANDYRAVDVEDAAGEVGDAWLGVFKSFDCGATWTSTLMPGHKLDISAQGLSSPLKGPAAAADPTVRAGTNGLFYYSGIAFNRGENGVGKVFVARFIDNNNKDGGDPIQYLGATQIDLGTSGQFLDKPWIVADVPRGGSTCSINGRECPPARSTWSTRRFVGGDNNVHSKIHVLQICSPGRPLRRHLVEPGEIQRGLREEPRHHDCRRPGHGRVHIAWREFATPGDSESRNAIIVARSTDGGQKFSKAAAITPNNYQFLPFDQASSPLTFRTNAYPRLRWCRPRPMAAQPASRAVSMWPGRPAALAARGPRRAHRAVRPSAARTGAIRSPPTLPGRRPSDHADPRVCGRQDGAGLLRPA